MSAIYFPVFSGEAECHKCELADCPCRGKYQRNRRDFTYTSGRCPKLPGVRGFADESQLGNQRKAYPLIHAVMDGCDGVALSISLPEGKKTLRVYETKNGYFYFKTRDEQGDAIKRVVFIGGNNKSRQEIIEYLKRRSADYCIFDCEISDLVV